MTATSAGGILFTAILSLILTTVFVSPATADTLGACVKSNSGNIKMADSAADCKNSEYFISWNDQGPIGMTGPAGNDGADGAPGATGSQGPIGLTGATGSDGNDGVDGQDGATGPQGPIGLAGTDGTNGSDGQDGLACWDLNGDGLQDPAEDINNDGSFNALDCAGPQGVAGATGAQGPQGDAGPAGADGAIGPQGPAGVAGAQGPIGLTGAPGADGNDGVDGQDGADGTTGPAGPRGPSGSSGSLIVRRMENQSETIPGFGTPVPIGTRTDSIVSCVFGELVGGGCQINYPEGTDLFGDTNHNGWSVTATHPSGNQWRCEYTCGARASGTGQLGRLDLDGTILDYVETPRLELGCTDTNVTTYAMCLSDQCIPFIDEGCE